MCEAQGRGGSDFVGLASGAIAAFLLASTFASATETTTTLDCGANALFVLLQLEGRGVSFEQLEEALPPRSPEGYSMAELAMTATSFGLRLEGKRFAKVEDAPNRPAIAFIKDKDAEDGHFVVVRPIGDTGTMVQIIDPPLAPWVADYARILEARQWGGKLLIAQEPWIVRNQTALLMTSGGVALVMPLLLSRLQTIRAGIESIMLRKKTRTAMPD